MAKEQTTPTTKKTPAKKAAVKKAVSKTNESAELKITIYGVDGKETKTSELVKEIFGHDVNPQLMAQYVRVYLANQRQGNASTKTRSEVIGTTAKVYRQKGTGRARHGSRKANLFVGGGITFGPKPMDHSLKMNKKQKRLALLQALSMKAASGSVAGVVNEFLTIEPKTKSVAAFLKTTGMTGKALIVLPRMEAKGIVLAARNLAKVSMVDAKTINPYMILNSDKILFVEEALDVVSSHFTAQS